MAKCRLTERITFIEEVITQNEGFENKIINDVATFWAARKDISGKEFTSNYQTNYEKIITFTVRGCKFTRSLVPNKFKIKNRRNIYNIVDISDFNNEHEWIDIRCLMVK